MRDIKFKVWDKTRKVMLDDVRLSGMLNKKLQCKSVEFLQYTGLKDKNGTGLIELYEGDIISSDGNLIGNIYEDNKGKADLVIPALGTKAWEAAYKEAVDRGFNYSE